MPATAQNLVDLLRFRARLTPDRTAYRFLSTGEEETATMTYGELERRAQWVAASLRERNAADQRAILLYRAGLDFVVSFFACLFARVVAVPVAVTNPTRASERMKSICVDAQTQF